MVKLFTSLCVILAVIGKPLYASADVPACASTLRYWDTYDAVTNCLRSNPVNEDKKAAAVDSLRLAIQNYAFVDIVKSPPDQAFVSPVDLTANLDKVVATTYANDAALQEGLANAFIPLHDAHTRYNKPKPYSATYFVQPLRFDSIVGQDGKQRVFIRYSAVDMDMYESLYGVPVIDGDSSLDGWEIVSMDGKDPVDVFTSGLDVSTSKDAGSRFNLAVNGYGDDKGYFGYRPIGKFAIPNNKAITYVLSPPHKSHSGPAADAKVTVSVNWMAMYQDAVPAIAQAVQAQLTQDKPKSWYEDEDRVRMAIHESMGVPYTIRELLTTRRYSTKPQPVNSASGTVPVADPSGVAYADYNDDVGILKVSTFGPPDMQVFRSKVEEAMHTFTQTNAHGTKKLILDLRANGGGDICLGYALHRYLFPTTNVHTNGHGPHSLARYDMIKSDLFTELATKGGAALASSPQTQLACGQDPEIVGYFTPCSWYGGSATSEAAARTTNLMLSSEEWLTKSVSRTRGGVTAEYSQLIHEGCEDEYGNWAPPGAGFGGVDPSRVMLLSDGLCGSTCSVFSSSVLLNGLAKTVVVGGLAKKDQLFWSFPGGEVETIEFLVSSAEELGVASPSVPKLLPDGATFRFAIREIYPWDTSYALGSGDNADFVPLEFVFAPSDFRIYYNSIFTDNEAVIQQVLPLIYDNLDSCPSRGYKSASTGACGTCPPGSAVNAAHDGCDCEYGVWSSDSQSCEWDSPAAQIQVISSSTFIQAVPLEAVLAVDTNIDGTSVEGCEQTHHRHRLGVVGVAFASFIVGVVTSVVVIYVLVARGDDMPSSSSVQMVSQSDKF